MRRLLAWLILTFFAVSAAAADTISIGFLGLKSDPRFSSDSAYARIALRPNGNPAEGARMAVADMAVTMVARDMDARLVETRVDTPKALNTALKGLAEQGAHYVLLDLPAPLVNSLASTHPEVTLINTTAPDDWLRRKCHSNLLHTAASDRMTADALVQYGLSQKWNSVLLLEGKTERDNSRADAFEQAAERYRLKVIDRKPFDLSTNPALREQNNTALLTATRRDYDFVFIADEDGEFARYLQYRTARPRPIVGAAGLVAREWHWAFERYGAPQVNSRFQSSSDGARRMGWQDWSAWIAVKAVLTAYAKSRDSSPDGVSAFLKSGKLRLDGSKGSSLSFRPWSGQLRMPILLTTHNAVLDLAPIEGFEHHTNSLDILGIDEAEFTCD